MEIIYRAAAHKGLRKMGAQRARRVRDQIEAYGAAPQDFRGDVRPLAGHWKGFLRLRLGSDRVIFRVDGDRMTVYVVGARGSVY